MTQNFLTILTFLFQQIWRFFTEFYIPGTNVTPAGFIFLILFTILIIRFVRRITFNQSDDK